MMAILPNHQKRSAPAPEFSRHNLAKPKMMTSTASHQERFSSHGKRGPSISFCSIGMRAPARPISLSKNCGKELPAGLAGAGDGVGLDVRAKEGQLKQPAIAAMRMIDSSDRLNLLVRMIAP